MEIKYYKDTLDFLAHAGKYLEKDEVRYGLLLGIVKTVSEKPNFYGAEKPWFCTVSADPKPFARLGSEMYAATWRTPPFMIGVAHFSGSFDAIAEQLVIAASRQFKSIPGVVGDKGLADRFAVRWCGKYGLKIQNTQAQRLYKLVKVNDAPTASGKLRVATEADKEILKKWSHGFHIDCFGPNSKVPEYDATRRITEGTVFIWEDNGKPVSMAVNNRATEKGGSVGGVYTPPELRGRGYATSCVAELSRNILQSGKQFCTLYTDLANPTSNSIYMKIGYKPICDSVQLTFEIPMV